MKPRKRVPSQQQHLVADVPPPRIPDTIGTSLVLCVLFTDHPSVNCGGCCKVQVGEEKLGKSADGSRCELLFWLQLACRCWAEAGRWRVGHWLDTHQMDGSDQI